MVTLSLTDPEVVTASKLLTSEECFRHLNLGILVRDEDFRSEAPALRMLAESAWGTGNPGFIFIDRVRRDHPFLDTVHACNPCGEQFLADDEGCNLGSLNLATFVSGKDIDWVAFSQAVELAVRFLDDVIDASEFPSARTADMAKRRRRIGLGVLGFASALHQLDVKYGSAQSVSIAEEWAAKLRRAAEGASTKLAAERGSFPESSDGRLRNSHLLSIAPTGAISLLWNVSSGIEPAFGESVSKGTIDINLKAGGNGRPPRADEIPARGHIAVLAAWQRYVDGGISKTINTPPTVSAGDILEAVREAWRQDCKGVAVFREASRAPAIIRRE
jgi:ribonucleoside-diphosphate reductase alpha chain